MFTALQQMIWLESPEIVAFTAACLHAYALPGFAPVLLFGALIGNLLLALLGSRRLAACARGRRNRDSPGFDDQTPLDVAVWSPADHATVSVRFVAL